MARSKLSVQVLNSSYPIDQGTIMLGERQMRKYKIPANQPITLRCGSIRMQVKFVSVPQYDGMRIHHHTAARLGIPYGADLGIVYKPSNRMVMIGPLLGVLISRVYPNSTDKPFGSNTTFCRELVDSAAQQGAYVCFFTVHQLSAGSSSIEAWSFRGRWYKTNFPIPNVIYNRITQRKVENKPSVQHFFREVKSHYGTKVFNEALLDKSYVFSALKKDPSSLKYLPESYLLKNFQMFKSMCQRYSSVFVKPVTGSLGKGILRISKGFNGSYICQSATVNGSRTKSYSSITKLFNAISGKLKQQRHQIQQGLQLIRVGGRPVDFRALMQKDGKGQWVITSIVARIAGGNHFVSNIAKGGTLSPVQSALAKSNVSQSKGIHTQLKKAALDIAHGIESNVKGHYAELGVDLAVDLSGKVWLIEVNSKPSKTDGTPLTEKKIRPSVHQTIEYVRYLSRL